MKKKANRSRAASLIRHLDEAERAYALGICKGEAREWLVWWEREGQYIRRAISGEDLTGLGYAPGPGFRKALEAALKVAWDGGGREAQLEAARGKLEG